MRKHKPYDDVELVAPFMRDVPSIVKYIQIDDSMPAFRESEGNAGLDMYLTEDTWIFPWKIVKLPLNIKIEIPSGYYGRIAPRSGITMSNAITVPGTIDNIFRGQVHCQMFKLGIFPRKIKKGTRVCQLIIQSYLDEANYAKASVLSATNRGDKGFGSTGTK